MRIVEGGGKEKYGSEERKGPKGRTLFGSKIERSGTPNEGSGVLKAKGRELQECFIPQRS